MRRFGACDSWLLRRSCTLFRLPRVRGTDALLQRLRVDVDDDRRRGLAERRRLLTGEPAQHRRRSPGAVGLHQQVRAIPAAQAVQRRRAEDVVAVQVRPRRVGEAAQHAVGAQARSAPSPARARCGGTAGSRAARGAPARRPGTPPPRGAPRGGRRGSPAPTTARSRGRRCPRGRRGRRAGRAARTCAPRPGSRAGRGRRRRRSPRPAAPTGSRGPSRPAACRPAPPGRSSRTARAPPPACRAAGVESASRRITVEAGERLGDQLLEPLGAGADAGDVDGGAGRAGARDPLAPAAVVAQQRGGLRCSVSATSQSGQPNVTPHERQCSAGASPRRFSSSTRAPALVGDRAERRVQRPRDRIASRRARRSTTSTGGRRPPMRPGSSMRSSGAPRLGPRGGGREQHGRAVPAGAQHGDGAGVVARVGVLLVGRLVLLVDHDQPEVGDRREQGRARADHDRRLAAHDPRRTRPPARRRRARSAAPRRVGRSAR